MQDSITPGQSGVQLQLDSRYFWWTFTTKAPRDKIKKAFLYSLLCIRAFVVELDSRFTDSEKRPVRSDKTSAARLKSSKKGDQSPAIFVRTFFPLTQSLRAT